MLRGFYTAASGILTQQRIINVLTNNMANVGTPGYRASRVVTSTFEQEFLTRIEGANTQRVGSGDLLRIVSEVPTQFDTSSLQETGRPMDMAITGAGFFNVLTTPEDGGDQVQYMTRNGNFELDENGNLVLEGVGVVLGQDGPIELDNSDFTVQPDGAIYDYRGRYVDTLLVTVPPDDAKVTRAANGLYQTEDMDANLPVPAETEIVQGWLEDPNIDLNREYTLVMEAQRAFQACSSALQIIDRIDQKAATQIASL